MSTHDSSYKLDFLHGFLIKSKLMASGQLKTDKVVNKSEGKKEVFMVFRIKI